MDKLALDRPAQHVDVEPGGEIRFKGSFVSKHDGSIVDAATTTWPEGTPGGVGVDAGGMVDFAAGGLRMTSRDPVTHEVVAIATGKSGPACANLGVRSPCVVVRTLPLAQSRLITMNEWTASLDGGIAIEGVPVPPPPVVSPVTEAATSPFVLGGLGVFGAAALFGLVWTVRRRQKLSPAGQMKALVARVSGKLKSADAALAVTLSPVVARTLESLAERKVDASSKEGTRVRDVLLRVEARLDETAESERAAREQEAADELVIEMESALEAAREAMSTTSMPRR